VVDVEVIIADINERKEQRQHGKQAVVNVLHLDKLIDLFIVEE
jgi:hypothetical protein